MKQSALGLTGADLILYEYPFNESMRTLLRLETLFDHLGQLLARDEPLDHHFALATLFEIIDVAARADLKTDLMKELERQRQQFNGFRGNPAIAEDVLDTVLAQLDSAFDNLNHMSGKAGSALAQNDWLMTLRSRIAIPGGTCEFDLPSYHAWQHRPVEARRTDLERWAATLRPVHDALALVLGLVRDTGSPQMMVARAGQFQQSLPSGRLYQLLRVRLDPALGLIPEISGHRLLISVRLMRADEEQRLRPSGEDASFELTICG